MTSLESIADQLDWRLQRTQRDWLDKAALAAELATVATMQGEALVADWLRTAANVYSQQASIHPSASAVERDDSTNEG